jgi:hypothetical protein
VGPIPAASVRLKIIFESTRLGISPAVVRWYDYTAHQNGGMQCGFAISCYAIEPFVAA